MAKIAKAEGVASGTVHVTVGEESFKVTDDKTYSTENAEVLAYAETDPLLTVEADEDSLPPAEAAKVERQEAAELARAREAADKQRATKDPREAPAPKPTSFDELEGDKR